MREDFAVFILSHGRAGRIKTLNMLKKGHYTGKTYIVIDDEDKEKDKYYSLYGDMVIEFRKSDYDGKFDIGDNIKGQRNVVVYARNAVFDIAEELGLNYFLVLDDDYTHLDYRFVQNDKFVGKKCKQFDKLFDAMIDFLEVSGALTVAFAQGGDFVGGKDGVYKKHLLRKAMNTFFCKTDRRFRFIGRINEDVNTYVNLGSRGKLFFYDYRCCD